MKSRAFEKQVAAHGGDTKEKSGVFGGLKGLKKRLGSEENKKRTAGRKQKLEAEDTFEAEDILDDEVFEEEETAGSGRTSSVRSARSARSAAKGQEPARKEEKLKKKPFRIVMLGNSGTGKTAFIAAMNCCMLQFPKTSVHLQLDKERDYKERYEDITNISLCDGNGTILGAFPPGTGDSNTIYPLKMYNDDTECCTFDFIDYKGALMMDLTNPLVLRDNLEELRDFLIESDVILIFVDGLLLSNAETPVAAKKAAEANRINSIISNILMDPQICRGARRKYDFLIVITKSDDQCIRPEDKERNFAGLIEKAEKAFEDIKPKCNSLAIVPVSAIGEGNADTISKGDNIWECTLKKDKMLKPEHIEISMIHACKCIINSRLEQIEDRTRELKAEMLRVNRLPLKGKVPDEKHEEYGKLTEELFDLLAIVDEMETQFMTEEMKYLRIAVPDEKGR